LTAFDSKFFPSITFADVSKAFDRVWIGALLFELERYGIKGDLHEQFSRTVDIFLGVKIC
jgi:hypothetical protein